MSESKSRLAENKRTGFERTRDILEIGAGLTSLGSREKKRDCNQTGLRVPMNTCQASSVFATRLNTMYVLSP
jgi:hypothetical protein